MSWLKRMFGEEQRSDTTGFLVFDYSAMDSYYGRQAFEAIYTALRSSSGVCAFHDGDVLTKNPGDTVREIARQANLVKPANSKSPLADLTRSVQFGAYFVGLWTDTYSNFRKLHDALTPSSLSGYLGYFTLPGQHEFKDAAHLFVRQLSLPASIATRDGSIIKGTSKYGIGFRPADGSLLRAAQLGEFDAARKALDEGADVDCIDPDDRAATPIIHAAHHGYRELTKLLLEKGADPNARNMGGNTALILAARFGHLEIVQLLIQTGVDVDQGSSSPGSPLKDAALSGHAEVVEFLLANGANPKLKDERGKTAADYAQTGNHADIEKRLRDLE